MEEAAALCQLLMETTEKFRTATQVKDDGSNISMGVTMYVGVLMACMKETDRDMMCDAMRGYALDATSVLDKLRT
jgi:hypothetical protein